MQVVRESFLNFKLNFMCEIFWKLKTKAQKLFIKKTKLLTENE